MFDDCDCSLRTFINDCAFENNIARLGLADVLINYAGLAASYNQDTSRFLNDGLVGERANVPQADSSRFVKTNPERGRDAYEQRENSDKIEQ